MEHPDALLIGHLRDHGEAPHEFRPRAEPSYFVRVEIEGREQTFWSPSLKRAMANARTRPQIGDEIGIRQVEIRPAANSRSRSDAAAGAQTLTLPAVRTYWVVERSAFFAERAAAAKALRDPNVSAREAIRAHPDLLGAYFTIDSARKVAETRIGNAESREKFVMLVREALAHATEQGEPLPSPKVRNVTSHGKASSPPIVRRREKGGRAR